MNSSQKIVTPYGDEYWLDNGGKYHRLDGPAVINSNGPQIWFQHGKMHRLYGPAIIFADGCESWRINDQNITEDILEWIAENNIPHWTKWTDIEKLHFRLRF